MQAMAKIPERFIRVLLLASVCLAGYLLAYKIVNVPAQLEIVVVFAAVTFFPILRFPKVGLYLLFIIMPLVPFFRRLYYLHYARPAADPLIVVGDILIAVITGGLYFEFIKQKDEQKNGSKINRWIFFYFFYLLLRVFFLNSLPLAEALMKYRFYGPTVLLFFAGILFGKDIILLKNIWYITIFSGIIAALYGVKQLIMGYFEFEKLWFSSISFTTLFIKGIARPFSFFQSPAAFADFMLLAMTGVIIIINSTKKFSNRYLLIFIPLFVYALLITSVRSNWIGALVILFLWIFLSSINNLRLRFGFILFLAALFISLQFVESYLNDKNEIQNISTVVSGKTNNEYFDLLVKQRAGALSNPFDEHSLLSRLALWKFLLTSSFDPILAVWGRGLGVLSADSLYFTYLAEFGYPGMIFIIVLSIVLIMKGFYVLDNSKDSSVIAIAKGVTIMNVAFGIINITGTHIHGFPGDVYFWFWNGVLIHFYNVLKNKNRDVNENTIDS
ncbi:MAG: hypothetical protein GX267_07095 [Fibrobacter sp.]|jgi:hypothetical protein|nr:hypothetical protein [Fibrobacter sp.]